MFAFLFALLVNGLLLTPSEAGQPLTLDNWIPAGRCDQLLAKRYYYSCYSSEHRQASWTLHILEKKQISGNTKRTDDFREDLDLLYPPVVATDYQGSGFDRGHLVPAGDMKLSRRSMSETFFMTNISPQKPGFNRGVWVRLENFFRSQVLSREDAIVITAPVLQEKLSKTKSGVAIPQYFYKIIYFPDAQEMLAFLIPNRSFPKSDLRVFQVTVDHVEAISGFDFFSFLDDSLEERLESRLPNF